MMAAPTRIRNPLTAQATVQRRTQQLLVLHVLLTTHQLHYIFTAWRDASTLQAIVACLSVTSRCSTKMVKCRMVQTMPYFLEQTAFQLHICVKFLVNLHPPWIWIPLVPVLSFFLNNLFLAMSFLSNYDNHTINIHHTQHTAVSGSQCHLQIETSHSVIGNISLIQRPVKPASLLFWHCSKSSCWVFQKQTFTGCMPCHPTNTLKVPKGNNLRSSTMNFWNLT